jgi:hypothetical protein
MNNSELATKIISKYGKAEKTTGLEWVVTIPLLAFRHTAVKTVVEQVPDKNLDGTPVKGGHVEKIDVAVKTTKQEAFDVAAEFLASELENGNIVLSDNWEKDNLNS